MKPRMKRNDPVACLKIVDRRHTSHHVVDRNDNLLATFKDERDAGDFMYARKLKKALKSVYALADAFLSGNPYGMDTTRRLMSEAQDALAERKLPSEPPKPNYLPALLTQRVSIAAFIRSQGVDVCGTRVRPDFAELADRIQAGEF